MTQEEKDLLLKDLCVRLPYGVMCYIKGDDTNTSRKLSRIEVDELDGILLDFWTDREDYLSIQVYLSEVKPYLRPMSDMTEEEKKEYHQLEQDIINVTLDDEGYEKSLVLPYFESLVDFYNSHHFDYRFLIEQGFAIAVTEENNPYKTIEE